MSDWLAQQVRTAGPNLHPQDFSDAEINCIVDLYEKEGVYMDSLPHTESIVRIAAGFLAKFKRHVRESDIHNVLIELRKSTRTSELVKKRFPRSKHEAPDWFNNQVGLAWDLYCDVRQTYATDELPYTPEFESIWQKFLVRSGCQCSRSQFYRVLCRIRKAPEGTLVARIRDHVEGCREEAARPLFSVCSPN